MSEREKLKKALDYYKTAFVDSGGPHCKTLVAAAEKHLATLPKTKEVQLWPVTWAANINGQWVEMGRLTHSVSDANDARAAHTGYRAFANATIHPPIVQVVPDEQ